VGPTAGLDDVEKRKFSTPPGLEIRPLGRLARSQSLYQCAILAPTLTLYEKIICFFKEGNKLIKKRTKQTKGKKSKKERKKEKTLGPKEQVGSPPPGQLSVSKLSTSKANCNTVVAMKSCSTDANRVTKLQ
jgi:hypothetical protein